MAKAKKRGNRRAENLAAYAGRKANKSALGKRATKAAAANAKAGHNSGEVPDEVIQRHWASIDTAEATWRRDRDRATSSAGVLRNRYKVAKSDGVDIDAMKKAREISERSVAEAASEHRNVGRYLRLRGAPIADRQLRLFSFLDDGVAPALEPMLAGEQAGREGASADGNPHKPGSEAFDLYHRGWLAGQATLGDEFQRTQ